MNPGNQLYKLDICENLWTQNLNHITDLIYVFVLAKLGVYHLSQLLYILSPSCLIVPSSEDLSKDHLPKKNKKQWKKEKKKICVI